MWAARFQYKKQKRTVLLRVHAPHVVVHIGALVDKYLLGSDLVQGLLEQVAHTPQLPLVLLHALDACNWIALMDHKLYEQNPDRLSAWLNASTVMLQ